VSKDDVETIRRGFTLFNRGQFDAALEQVFHPEIEIVPGVGPLLGVERIRGRDRVRRFWTEDLPAGFDDFRVEAVSYEDLGDIVLVESRYQARGPASGMDIEQTFISVYRFADGLIRRIEDHPTREAALAAARGHPPDAGP
jgi:ketosteroid isomerase-like protein